MEKNGKAVKEIRSKNLKITNKPIVYYWWFSKKIISTLLYPLDNHYDKNRIKYKKINNQNYGLLYIGRAKDGNDRLVKYHIFDSSNFHNKGIENGRLSSLRQTLCGLLKIEMSKGKDIINEYIDNHCFVEWDILTSNELVENEKKLIKANYLPLNHQNTKGILTPEHRKILTKLKQDVKV